MKTSKKSNGKETTIETKVEPKETIRQLLLRLLKEAYQLEYTEKSLQAQLQGKKSVSLKAKTSYNVQMFKMEMEINNLTEEHLNTAIETKQVFVNSELISVIPIPSLTRSEVMETIEQGKDELETTLNIVRTFAKQGYVSVYQRSIVDKVRMLHNNPSFSWENLQEYADNKKGIVKNFQSYSVGTVGK